MEAKKLVQRVSMFGQAETWGGWLFEMLVKKPLLGEPKIEPTEEFVVTSRVKVE